MTIPTERLEEMLRGTEGVTPENGYVLIKRGLYWRPNSQGYTGILAHAGLYSDADSAKRLGEGVTRQRFTEAAEVASATYADIACDYWREQALALRAQVTELSSRRADTVWQMPDSAPRDGKPVTLLLSSGREVDQAWWGANAIADSDEDDGLEGWRDHKGWVRGEDESVIRWCPWRSPPSASRADTVEAAEVVPVAWIGRNGDDEPYVTWRREVADAWNAEPLEPVYSQATVESLSSQVEGLKVERDEAQSAVTAWQQVFGTVEAHLMDRVNMRDEANPQRYLDIIRYDVAHVDEASKRIVASRWHDYQQHEKRIAALEIELAASLASQAIPEGFVLAPKEPTEAMYDPPKAPTSFANFIRFADFYHSYKAALAAIPAAPEVNK